MNKHSKRATFLNMFIMNYCEIQTPKRLRSKLRCYEIKTRKNRLSIQ